MAKTTAERQAAYRSRKNDGEGERRIDTRVSVSAHLALDRLAQRYRVTRREMLERLITDADDVILKTLQIDTPEWDIYLTVTR
ncbi:MAG: hypothetical protein ACOYL3_22265 [Desulfuromonadaceae bacterium]